jgi:hypothetical protein
VAQFFSDLRGGIARECQRENPRIALLTPAASTSPIPNRRTWRATSAFRWSKGAT